jgi:hypothetical protein
MNDEDSLFPIALSLGGYSNTLSPGDRKRRVWRDRRGLISCADPHSRLEFLPAISTFNQTMNAFGCTAIASRSNVRVSSHDRNRQIERRFGSMLRLGFANSCDTVITKILCLAWRATSACHPSINSSLRTRPLSEHQWTRSEIL